MQAGCAVGRSWVCMTGIRLRGKSSASCSELNLACVCLGSVRLIEQTSQAIQQKGRREWPIRPRNSFRHSQHRLFGQPMEADEAAQTSCPLGVGTCVIHCYCCYCCSWPPPLLLQLPLLLLVAGPAPSSGLDFQLVGQQHDNSSTTTCQTIHLAWDTRIIPLHDGRPLRGRCRPDPQRGEEGRRGHRKGRRNRARIQSGCLATTEGSRRRKGKQLSPLPH